MQRRLIVMAALAAVLGLPQFAAAQEQPIRMTVRAGADGLVASGAPIDLLVEVSADVLFAGEIGVRAGPSSFTTPVDVPAGSSKTYSLTIPPIDVVSDVVTVQLLETGGTAPLLSERIQLRVPDGERVIVGVAGGDVDPVLARTLTAIGDLPLETVLVGDGARLEVLDYLMLADSVVDDDVRAWVDSGGRLIGAPGVESTIELELTDLGTFPGTDTAWYLAGDGEVLVDDAVEETELSRVLRPVERTEVAGAGSVDRNLTQAAGSGSQSERIPSISWLLVALVIYALVAGPVVFVTLGRLRRRDLAWVVGPVLSVVTLTGFWMLGRQQLADSFVSHGSVVVLDDDARVETGVVFAAGSAGTYSLAVPGATALYGTPVAQFGDPGGGLVVSDGVATFDLPQLGFAGVRATVPWQSGATLEATVVGDRLDVVNRTGVDLIAWGVASGVGGVSGSTSLGQGESGSVAIAAFAEDGFGFLNPAEVVGDTLGFDDNLWETWYPLGEYAASLGHDRFAFGFAESLPVAVSVDGVVNDVSGVSVFVVPIDGPSSGDRGELLATEPGSFVENLGQDVMVNGASAIIGMTIPPEVTDPRLVVNARMGMPPNRMEAWNWLESAFEPVEEGEVPARTVNAAGQIVLRIWSGDQFGGGLVPGDIEVRWSR